LFRNLPTSFLARIERSIYNRRRRNLVSHLEIIRLKLAFYFNDFEDYFIIDNLPLVVCKLARSSRSKIYKEGIKQQINDCTLIGDRGYLSTEIQLNLLETYTIKLNTTLRINLTNFKNKSYVFY
jgi:hypothetical protein